jgi:hypothetical protein
MALTNASFVALEVMLLTVKLALALVTLPAELLTTTL